MNYQPKFTPGQEMSIITASRQSGKSIFADMVQQLAQPTIQILDKVLVDNEVWYSVRLNMPAAEWARQQDQTMWYEHYPTNWQSSGLFDVKEQLYTMLALKWK